MPSKRIVVLLVLGLVAVLAPPGCRKGPDGGRLKGEVQRRLDKRFEPGLFKVASLRRKGHYPYRAEGDDRERLLVYYNAEIRFEKDYALSNWNKLNVGSLISVLGATPLGVEGVKTGGNKRGDQLAVRGSLAFVQKGGGWAPSDRAPTAREKGKAPPKKDVLPYRRHLEDLGAVGKELQSSAQRGDLHHLTSSLRTLLADARRRLGRSKGWVTIATGDRAGEYYRQGRGLAKILSLAKVKARAYSTSGSMENCQLVDSRQVLFGYSQNDIAKMAFAGQGLFAGRVPARNLRGLCSLYPEAVQIVARAASKIVKLEDLRGKKIGIGAKGSGVRVNALELLRAAGLALRDLAGVHEGDLASAIAALEGGRIDALFFTSAYPNPAVSELASSVPVRLVPLDPKTIEQLRRKHSSFIPLTLPRSTYRGTDRETPTVGVTAMLIAHKDAPPAKVRQLLTHLFDNVDALSRGSLQAYYISPKTALAGVSIPLHLAAEAFFSRRKR